MRNTLYLMLLWISICSCSTQEVCDTDPQPDVVAQFKTMGPGTPVDTLLSDLSIYGIREGQPDSLLLDSMQTQGAVLPPDPGNDISRFVFLAGGEADTLTIHYQREFYLISYSCGFGMRYMLQAVERTGSMIVETEIRNASVNDDLNQDEAHLWIYF